MRPSTKPQKHLLQPAVLTCHFQRFHLIQDVPSIDIKGQVGGTKSTRYTFTGSMLDQKGIVINSGYHRAQFRLALDQPINKNLKIGVNVNYSWLKKYGGSPIPNDGAQFTSVLMYSILGYRPVTGNDITDLAMKK
ncbi:MAG: hypothetical protein J0G98_13795 [Terrimonas ferruginea]|uniref:hypothetical protein n=1 Tax=Terrimonas ferruginea TaxID=249 RepID=UPI000A7EACE4|nr:hypothetical protein [Terrimonas ferruginea]MBN8784128.1 hypothetical protein [Terrimonas ferruginea]